MPTDLSNKILFLLSQVPKGKIVTYGLIAEWAGNPKASRAVAWLLRSSSQSKELPWHRVLNRQGKISLPWEPLGKKQAKLLKNEQVVPNSQGKYDLEKQAWKLPT